MRWFILLLFGAIGGWAMLSGIWTAIRQLMQTFKSGQGLVRDRKREILETGGLIAAGIVVVAAGMLGFSVLSQAARTPVQTGRAHLHSNVESLRIAGTVTKVEPRQMGAGQAYVVVCRGFTPGESAARKFTSDPLYFDPGSNVVGRKVNIYIDPQDRTRYEVHLDPLFVDMMIGR